MFNILTVKDIRQETPSCVSVAFSVPEHLKSSYQYKAGQYLTLKFKLDGIEYRRSYSLSSSPNAEDELRIAVKKLDGGKVSSYINDHLKVGDAVESMQPLGSFTPALDAQNAIHYVLFAAGSGITPVWGILKSVLKAEPNSKVTLFYSNTRSEDTIYGKEIAACAAQNPDRLAVHLLYSRAQASDRLFEGRIDLDKCRLLMSKYVSNKSENQYYICGPEAMIRSVSDTLISMQVPKGQVHFELFTAPVAATTEKSPKSKHAHPMVHAHVLVVVNGEETDFSLETDGDSILDAAMIAGADVPFACKGGVCCTCRAKVLKGSAFMDINYALSEEEVADGYILACQAHPTTGEIVVDFDL